MATVIFADGSKQMAHNLDDTRERWHLRVTRDADDVRGIWRRGIIIPDYTTPGSIDEAHEQRQQLVDMLAKLRAQAAIVDAEVRFDQRKVTQKPISVAVHEISRQLSAVNAYIKQYNVNTRDQVNEDFIQHLREENNALKRRIAELEARLGEAAQ